MALVGLLIFTSTRAFSQTSTKLAKPQTKVDGSVFSDSVLSQLREAARLLQLGKPSEAEPILRHVISIAPRNPDAHNLLGTILDQQGKFIEAEREYREALRLNPNVVSPLANLGVLLARTKRSDEAVKAFEIVLQKVPNHPQATLNLGLQYVAHADYARGVTLLNRAREFGLDSYQLEFNLGLALYNLKRYDEASAALQSSHVLSPNSATPLYYLGLVAWASGQDETAADLWDQAIQLQPTLPEANFMLGEALRKNRRAEASIGFYQRALDQDPNKFIYYARLGGTYVMLGQSEAALEVFSRGLKRFPRLPEAHYFVGIAARAKADYALAEAELRKSLTLRPDNVDTLAQLGFIVGERDRHLEAEKLLHRAIAINNKHFYANYDLGRILVKSKRYEEALPILKHAATLKSRNPGVHYQMFIALSRLKRKDEADRELAVFKQLEADRKAHPEAEDDDVENPTRESDSPQPGVR
jgi:superkiller protein 3